MKTEALTPELARKYKTEITRFYFDNVRSCRFLEHYTWEEAEAKTEGFIDHLENNECISFGAFENGEMIGFIWAYPHKFREENRMYVNEIRVREGCRHKGVGKSLLSAVEAKTKEMGLPAIYLTQRRITKSAWAFMRIADT